VLRPYKAGQDGRVRGVNRELKKRPPRSAAATG